MKPACVSPSLAGCSLPLQLVSICLSLSSSCCLRLFPPGAAFGLPVVCVEPADRCYNSPPFLPSQQYQDAIRAHRAGRKVDFAELPVPPGKWCLA